MASNFINLWWAIDGFLAGTGMPYIAQERRYNLGGNLEAYEDDLPLIYSYGIRAAVCLLNIPSDKPVFQTAGFEFECLPIMDGQPPTVAQASEFNAFVESCRLRNLPVVVFCEAGVGRTGTIICCYLIYTGMTAAQAIAHVRAKESSAVETKAQILFLEEFSSKQQP
jgi:atypical dual specificity phosphatase